MKKVKMKISIASANWSYIPGQEVELEDYVADAWVKCGHADPVEDGDDANGGKSNYTTSDRTAKSGGSKTVSKN
jgi:hypothetical protein